jgi:hypothetical protein
MAASEQYGPGSKGGSNAPLNCSLEKVSDLMAGFLGVVDRGFRDLQSVLSDIVDLPISPAVSSVPLAV